MLIPRAAVPPDGRRLRPELVHALAARQGTTALHARRDDRRPLRGTPRSRRRATARSSSCARRRSALPPSTRRTSGWSRAATSTTRRSGSSTRPRRSREIEVIGAGMLADREVIPQAMKLNPALFETIYTGLLNTPKSRATASSRLSTRSMATWRRAPRRCSRRSSSTFATAGEARSCTEIENHFKRHFDVSEVTTACEYLADQGLIGKVSVTTRLTRKSTGRRAGNGVRVPGRRDRAAEPRRRP